MEGHVCLDLLNLLFVHLKLIVVVGYQSSASFHVAGEMDHTHYVTSATTEGVTWGSHFLTCTV